MVLNQVYNPLKRVGVFHIPPERERNLWLYALQYYSAILPMEEILPIAWVCHVQNI
jgi:hypothetical protein